MWIWWIISLIVLVAAFIFTYHMIVSSNDYLPEDKKFSFGFKKDFSESGSPGQQEIIRNLRNQLKLVEENAAFYEIQFTKFQQRLKVLEESCASQQDCSPQVKQDEEDWKELYYQENEVKEKLENELDETRQKLEAAESELNSIKENKSQSAALKSDYDARLNDLQSMQNNIGLMQRQLEAAAQREKELEEILLSEITIKKKYAQLESQHLALQSENDDLRRQIFVAIQKVKELESRSLRLNELESTVSIFKEEKAKIIADLETVVSKNKMFSFKKIV